MFDFSWSELLLIGMVALIFIGPKELPGVLRTLGQWMTKIRRMAGDFQNQFHDAMREAELADLKKEVDDMAAQAANYSNFDPLADVRKEMESAQRDIESAVADKPAAQSPAAGEPAAAGERAAAGEPAAAAPPATGAGLAETASHPEAPLAEPDEPAGESAAVAAAGDPAKEPVKQHAAGSEPA
jgi:sec-independent protein translocase protein TatB